MRKRKGFKFQGGSYHVYFESFNERVVKCHILGVMCDTIGGIETFTGMAKCNVDAGDVFDEEKGMTISFRRALRQLEIYQDKRIERLQRLSTDIIIGLNDKCARLIDKQKIGNLN